MARTRSLKPGFFKNEILGQLPLQDQLLFAGLWTLADRSGRLEDRPARIKAEIFPYRNIDVEASLCRLHQAEFIIRYTVDAPYITIPTFAKHQSPHVKEQASTIPAPGMSGACTGQAHPYTGLPYTGLPSTLNPESEENRMPPKLDDQWQEFRKQYMETGKPLIEEDFSKAHFLWAVMDFEQRTTAVAGIGLRKEAGQWEDANFVPLPEKYLRSEYKRGVIPRINGNSIGRMSAAERIDKAIREA